MKTKKITVLLVIVLLMCAGIFNSSNGYAYSKSYTNAGMLESDINTLVHLANIKSPETFDAFIKVTKECYPEFKTTITKKEFNKFLEIGTRNSVSKSEINFINQFTNKLKNSYYGTPGPALRELVKADIKNQINKMTHDLMKNRKCSYNIAYSQAVGLMVNSNPGIAKFVNEKSSYNILSTENSRKRAFLYARPHDIASVLSNWGDMLIYSVWTSHDGWVRGISLLNGDIKYLDIYEAFPNGNLYSPERYQYKPRGAYDSWIKHSKKYVYIQRYPDSSLSSRAYNVSVYMYHGKPFNWNIANKYDSNRSYCSQNVWRGFWACNIDLDSNLDIPYLYLVHPLVVSFELTGVLPDSIHLSPHLELVSSG